MAKPMNHASQPQGTKPVFPRRWQWMLLLGSVLAGMACRLAVALSASWAGDEGYMAELARGLGSWRRPQISGLWQDGFFPLSAGPLAALSALPLAEAPWWNALTGVRLWAVLTEGLAVCLLAALGRSQSIPNQRRMFVAAALYAVLPFAVAFGGRAYYHHLAVLFLLATLLFGPCSSRAAKAAGGPRQRPPASPRRAAIGCGGCLWAGPRCWR
jgi:hypothetical protein